MFLCYVFYISGIKPNLLINYMLFDLKKKKNPLHLCRAVAKKEEQEGKQGDQLGSPCSH